MSTPLDLNSGGGSYGTTNANGGGGRATAAPEAPATTARQRRNPPSDSCYYGPFGSPHGSFDDAPPPSSWSSASHPSQSFSVPPYAELPPAAMLRRRRRGLDGGNSFVKWAMRGVLLSPLVVLVLWSVVSLALARPHQVAGNGSGGNGNSKQQLLQRRASKRGAGSPAIPPPLGVTGQQQQPLQLPPQGDVTSYTYGTDGAGNPVVVMMMAAPPQQQQQVGSGQQVSDQYYMATASGAAGAPLYTATASGAAGAPMYMAQQAQPQGQFQFQLGPPRGDGVPDMVDVPALEAVTAQLQGLPAAAPLLAAPQSMADTPGYPLKAGNRRPAVAHRPSPRATLDSLRRQAAAAVQPLMGGEAAEPSPIDGAVVVPSATLRMEDPAALTPPADGGEDLLQASPTRQAVYYYDPRDARVGRNGELLSLPTVVYTGRGRAVPLSELPSAPIYVQPPPMGAALAADGGSSAVDGDGAPLEALTPQALGAVSLQQWGSSTAQDQTIIVATVAVMALLVGALSARRLRSKSFLAACIENETLEDDMAYDSAYTTTAGGGGGAQDSSYNTFGGWRGDLEKFDV